MTHVRIISPTSLRSASPRAHRYGELAADRQGLKQFTTPQHRQLQLGSLLDDLVSDHRVRRVKSFGSVLSHLKPLREHFGDWRAMDITFRVIEACITTRREDEKSNATINRELELLRRALRLAHDRQLLPSLPKVRVLPENNTRQGFFERPDLSSKVLPHPENATQNPSNRSRHQKWGLLVNVYTCIIDRAPEQESIRSPIERAIASKHRRAEHLRGHG